MLSVSLLPNLPTSSARRPSAGPNLQADDKTHSAAGRRKQACTTTVLGLELFLNSVRKIITENDGIVFLKLLLSAFQVIRSKEIGMQSEASEEACALQPSDSLFPRQKFFQVPWGAPEHCLYLPLCITTYRKLPYKLKM